ncbi:hypothetical protein HYR99_39770 [Candidatus Poribacteria bacterium]|nr:hypothetical protein [Candidatus Poribacteria bacterium]
MKAMLNSITSKERVLIASAGVMLIGIVLYEVGVLRLEFSNPLALLGCAGKTPLAISPDKIPPPDEDERSVLVLKKGDNYVGITRGTKISIFWDTGSDSPSYTGVVFFKGFNVSLRRLEVSSPDRRMITLPIDQIRLLTIQKGNRVWELAGTGFLVGGLIGTAIGTAIFSPWITDGSQNNCGYEFSTGDAIASGAIFFGVPSGIIGGLWGGAAGSRMIRSTNYPIGPNEWGVVIE